MKRFFVITGALGLALASCAKDGEAAARKKSVSIGRFGVRQNTVPGAPEAVSVPETPAVPENKNATKRADTAAEESVPDFTPPKSTNQRGKSDGIRLPNMLDMPGDRDLKATSPAGGKSGSEGGGVISRPPVEKKE
jgi:hypothetical protein